MMRRMLSVTVLIGAVAISAHAEEISQQPIEILSQGQFHGDEVKAQSGELWFGLYLREKEYVLLPVRLEVTPAFDAIMDYIPGTPEEQSKKTGKAVKAVPLSGAAAAEQEEQPVILVRGGGLVPGPVTTAFPPDNSQADYATRSAGSFAPLEAIYMELGETRYSLNLTLRWSDEHQKENLCGLTLNRNRNPHVQQMIARQPNTETEWNTLPKSNMDTLSCHPGEGFPTLLWAGDLDRDGGLDLLLNPNYHYNVGATTLFLSSQATGGELVKRVASFIATGC